MPMLLIMVAWQSVENRYVPFDQVVGFLNNRQIVHGKFRFFQIPSVSHPTCQKLLWRGANPQNGQKILRRYAPKRVRG